MSEHIARHHTYTTTQATTTAMNEISSVWQVLILWADG